MSGGAWEHVAAYINNGSESLNSYGSSVLNGVAKTKEVYESVTSTGENTELEDYAMAANRYGDAIYEISVCSTTRRGVWYEEYTSYPYENMPFFAHGGDYRSTTLAGIFAFAGGSGEGETISEWIYTSFRPVLVVL